MSTQYRLRFIYTQHEHFNLWFMKYSSRFFLKDLLCHRRKANEVGTGKVSYQRLSWFHFKLKTLFKLSACMNFNFIDSQVALTAAKTTSQYGWTLRKSFPFHAAGKRAKVRRGRHFTAQLKINLQKIKAKRQMPLKRQKGENHFQFLSTKLNQF